MFKYFTVLLYYDEFNDDEPICIYVYIYIYIIYI